MFSPVILPFLLCSSVSQRSQPDQVMERTVFQTSSTYRDRINLRADVAIVYGIDATMPDRVIAWRKRGYRVHLMTGVAWGEYQDYYYGRFDGINHEDEAQTRQSGEKIGHGRDVYYMSPGSNYGKYLALGVKRALDAGVEAVHLEEPEFWVGGGYGEGFKKEWLSYYHQPWQDPLSSPDARWHAARLMYFLYRRALQQVFDSIQNYNKLNKTGVRCYVPTHSLINYASWGIVSPESSLARLSGCDGYIAQVWTGTARTPNYYQGVKRERTFETAFLEYGSMQNLVRSTGRGVWYLADPIEDNPDHDWGNYRRNYQSTLVASLLQPDVSQYEVMPWPERIFDGKYPSEADPKVKVPIPGDYSSELQVVINSLKNMRQSSVEWSSGSRGIGVVVSDSLMFERGGPESSDDEMGHFFGLALPFIKRGMPVRPVQLENVALPHYLDDCKVLLMTYEGMKPLSPAVHGPIAQWVRDGGTLVFVDADLDPYAGVREWWNSDGSNYRTPREHLFRLMGVPSAPGVSTRVGKGHVLLLSKSPTQLSRTRDGARFLANQVRSVAKNLTWHETSAIVLRRGPYVVAAAPDETDLPMETLHGHFVDLFDPELKPQTEVALQPGTERFLVDLDRYKGPVVAVGGNLTLQNVNDREFSAELDGISGSPTRLLIRRAHAPLEVRVDGEPTDRIRYDHSERLLCITLTLGDRPRHITVR